MKKFKILITETLQKQLIVEAENIEEALKKVNKAYDDGRVELDYENLTGKTIAYVPGLEGEE